MDSALPVAVPPSFKSRRGWLIAFGVVEILIACFFLVMIAFSAFAFYGPVAAKMPPNAMAGPFPRSALMAVVCVQYGLIAAVFLTGGIGSVRCRNWARVFMLVVSGLWLAFGLMTTLATGLMFPVIMRQQPAEIPAGIEHAILVMTMVAMGFFGIVLPAIFLFFYSRKGVKATCLAQNAGPAAMPAAIEVPGFPVLLAILGAWEALGMLGVLAILIMRVTLAFGFIIRGPAAVLILLVHSVLSGSAAWFIFRRNLLGWKIALAKNAFWFASAFVTFLRKPDIAGLIQQMGYDQQSFRIYEQYPQFMPSIWLGTLVMMAVLIALLVYARRYFPKKEMQVV